MGLWNQLTGKEDADKANKKARQAQEDNFAKIRREEYQSAVTASQLTNALLMSDIADNMAGRGITDEIRADYENRLQQQTTSLGQRENIVNQGNEMLNYFVGGGGITRTRGKNIRYYSELTSSFSNMAEQNRQEIDRIEGILGVSN